VGRAVSLALAAEGCNLVVHYNRSADAALEVVAAAEAAGVGALAVGADLADAVAPEVIFDAAAVLGPPTLLVNSASAFPADRLTDLNRAIWENTLAVSLSAPLFLARELACRLDGETQGAVVNITDWRSARPYPDHVAYTVAKGGLDALTAAAAVVLAPSIRVNAVALGAILPRRAKVRSICEISLGAFRCVGWAVWSRFRRLSSFWPRPISSPGRRFVSTAAPTWCRQTGRGGAPMTSTLGGATWTA